MIIKQFLDSLRITFLSYSVGREQRRKKQIKREKELLEKEQLAADKLAKEKNAAKEE